NAGDTLSTIGQRYGVDYRDIASANGIQNPNLIQPGQRLNIASSAGRPQSDAGPGASTAYQTPIGTGAGQIPDWLSDVISKYAGDLANEPNFIRSVAAGAKGESGWDPRAVGDNGASHGLFQFNRAGGMGPAYRST